MNKKGYLKAKKNHYNVKIIKGEHAEALTRKAEAEAKAKPEVIRNKADLMQDEKSRLLYSIEYKRTQTSALRKALTRGFTEAEAKRFKSIEVEVEAVQRIDAEAEAEAEAKTAIARYETCADFIAEAEAEKMYKPIDAMLWAFCRKQKTREALAIMEYTENGLRKNLLAYEDYKQTCFMILFEYCLEKPENSFAEALYLCMKKGIYEEWAKTHKRMKNADGTESVRIDLSLEAPFDASEPESGSLKTALPDTLSKPLDFDIIQAEACERIYDKCKGSEAVYIADLADGYNCKEIAYFNGKSHDAIRQTVSRAKKRIAKDLHKEAEARKAEAEARKAEAEASRKACEPCEPEFYHDMSHVVPFIESVKPCEYPLPNAEAVNNTFNRATYSVCIMDGKRTKRTYVKPDGSTENKVKPEAVLNYVKHEKPEAVRKYSTYDNEKLIADIRKADIKRAKREAWEAENASYCAKLYAGIGK